MRCGQFLLLVIQSGRLVADRAVASVLLLLKEIAPELLIASVNIECVLAFCSQKRHYWAVYEGLSKRRNRGTLRFS